jgi:hypothetical protein
MRHTSAHIVTAVRCCTPPLYIHFHTNEGVWGLENLAALYTLSLSNDAVSTVEVNGWALTECILSASRKELIELMLGAADDEVMLCSLR